MDAELVEAVRGVVRTGSEVAAHGWIHEDLAQLTASEQEVQFLRAKNRLWNTLEVNTLVLTPPTCSYSNDTLLAMNQAGYEIVSGYAITSFSFFHAVEIELASIHKNNKF